MGKDKKAKPSKAGSPDKLTKTTKANSIELSEGELDSIVGGTATNLKIDIKIDG
jgi:hypothetical protein